MIENKYPKKWYHMVNREGKTDEGNKKKKNSSLRQDGYGTRSCPPRAYATRKCPLNSIYISYTSIYQGIYYFEVCTKYVRRTNAHPLVEPQIFILIAQYAISEISRVLTQRRCCRMIHLVCTRYSIYIHEYVSCDARCHNFANWRCVLVLRFKLSTHGQPAHRRLISFVVSFEQASSGNRTSTAVRAPVCDLWGEHRWSPAYDLLGGHQSSMTPGMFAH